MSDDDLKSFLKTIASKIEPDGELGSPERRKLKTGGMAYCRRWDDLDPSVELSWGVSGSSSKTRTAEYVRLVLTPKKALAKPSTRAESGPDARTKAQSNVSKGPGGDVWIKGVPMVDQGEKGYCAVATTERVMRYYGIAVDEHELAHMAKSSAEGGTSVSAMIDVVKMVGSKHRLGYSEIVRMTKSVDDVVREVKAYNKVAKVEKGEQISLDAHTVNRRIDTTSLREAMDPEILRKMRVKDGRYRKFLSEVQDAGRQGSAGVLGRDARHLPRIRPASERRWASAPDNRLQRRDEGDSVHRFVGRPPRTQAHARGLGICNNPQRFLP